MQINGHYIENPCFYYFELMAINIEIPFISDQTEQLKCPYP